MYIVLTILLAVWMQFDLIKILRSRTVQASFQMLSIFCSEDMRSSKFSQAVAEVQKLVFLLF
jgi:hypothetical protein